MSKAHAETFSVLKKEPYASAITEIVNEILVQKENDTSFETTVHERKIDQLVYQLYDLTAEEIAIIENS